MTTATLKEERKHRAYENKYPSVTTILGVLRKPALEYWFKNNTIQFINRESAKGKSVGTDIHKAIENYVLTGEMKVETEYPDEVTNALNSFALFRKENRAIQLQWSEMALTSEEYKFNGTIDCIANIVEQAVGETHSGIRLTPIILDWKTGQAKEKETPDIYDEYKYQVSAYVKLYNEVQKQDIKEAIIVSVAKDKVAYNTYKLNEEEINDCFNEVFLPALRILNYQRRK
jgi:hypothetical protein